MRRMASGARGLGTLWAAWCVIAVSLVAACSAHQPIESTWTDEQKDPARPLRDTETLGQPPATYSDADGGTRASLGVRHDLGLAQGSRTEKCSCLAVEVGAANEPKFQWTNGTPEVTADAVVIAVSTRGVSCPGGEQDEAKRRGSISAVDRDGVDVLVEIEEVPEGRPIASGAIIPKPGPGGAVYVRPKNARVPYARPAAGGRCRVF